MAPILVLSARRCSRFISRLCSLCTHHLRGERDLKAILSVLSIKNKTTTSALAATILGGIIIVAGYFIAEYFVFDPGVAIASILTNAIQAVMSVIISMILYAILRRRLA